MPALRQFRGSVSGAASDIEDAGFRNAARGECIAGNVLGPKVVIHLAGNHALARELAHNAAAPAPIFELTSTRHGKRKWP